MRLTREDKAKNRERILEAAGKLFRQRGIDGVAIADVMGAAGFTCGGFYNHFDSKEALAAQVCDLNMEHGNVALEAAIEQAAEGAESQAVLRRHVEAYLAPSHRDTPDQGCTAAALLGEMAHQASEVQAPFHARSKEYVALLTRLVEKAEGLSRTQARSRALGALSQMLGAMNLSRALLATDPKMADEVLVSARRALLRT